MLMIISPSQTMNVDDPPPLPADLSPTHPRFLDEAAQLMDRLKQDSVDELASRMRLSDNLAELNTDRHQTWAADKHTAEDGAHPAVMAFGGTTYDGLDAPGLSTADLTYAQDHLRILTGLYGVLRPLDLIQAYRLSMKTKLPHTADSDSLYDFWHGRITPALNEAPVDTDAPLINLASNEYLKAVDKKALSRRIVTPKFKDWRKGTYKTISFYAKKMRGALARYIIVNRITDPAGLTDFTADDYLYNPELSTAAKPTFTRK